ncbi:O-antigen ligase family protein [Bradyrhizobium sp. USDA 3397]
MYSNDEKYAAAAQMLGVGLMVASALCFMVGNHRIKVALSLFDGIMLFSILLSYGTAAATQETYVFAYTTVFLITYLAILIITNSMQDDEMMHCLLASILIILALVLIVFGSKLLVALAPGALRRWELREAPFGMHPNLAGFVYGGFIIIIANTSLGSGKWRILIKTVAIALCLAVMLAASARGGLLAVSLTLSIYVFGQVLQARSSTLYLGIAGIALFAILILFWDHIAAYAAEMLDLNSKERGVESGGTGRVDIWRRGIEFIGSRSWEIFLGSGLRSATMDNVGFPTESSYINITIESGLFFTFALLCCFLYMLKRAYALQLNRGGFFRLAFYALIFALFQSVFNRYLIAIGNPFSLCILLFSSRLSSRLAARSSFPQQRSYASTTPSQPRLQLRKQW